MNHVAESSSTARRGHADAGPRAEAQELAHDAHDASDSPHAEQLERAQQRRLNAKRKRIQLLNDLLRDLDSLVYVELLTLYYLDCSFFWFLVRSIVHVAMLSPLPDLQLAHQQDEHKPFLPLVLGCFVVNAVLHSICRAPAAGEETRGYLHGGLMIDFIGQQGPTGKWKLVALDVAILLLQLVMVSVTVKKRALKKNLAAIASPATTEDHATTSNNNNETPAAAAAAAAAAHRDQDADAEERGVLRRSDTLSNVGTDAEPDEQDALLSVGPSGSSPADALELLSSGQSIVGSFTLFDTLFQEHADYQVWRQTRAEASSSPLTPATLRELHRIRTTIGAIGGG